MFDKILQANNRVHAMNSEMHNACKNIHPQLCSRLVVRTIDTPSLYDDNLKVRFDAEIVEMRNKFKEELRVMCNEIINDYLKSLLMLKIMNTDHYNDNIGIICADGEEVQKHNVDQITIDNYRTIAVLDYEAEDFCQMVHAAIYAGLNVPTPFWTQASYTSRGTSEVVIFACPESDSTPTSYIDYNKSNIRHGSFLNAPSSVKLTRAIKILDGIEGAHISSCDDLISQSGAANFIVNVATNHVILDAVLKNNTGFGEYTVNLDDTFKPVSVEHKRKWG